MIDVVCYYADFGRPYQPLIERMFLSARRVMDCHTVILTPTPKDWMWKCCAEVVVLEVKQPTTLATLARDRVVAWASWMLRTDKPALLVDPDICFQRAPDIPDDCDVALLWRRKKADQPINNGAIFARNGCHDFWRKFGTVTINLPPQIHHWWCDQIAVSLMTGIYRKPGDRFQIEDARVYLWDAYKHCAPAKEADSCAWALHYKGVEKGEEFRQITEGVAA